MPDFQTEMDRVVSTFVTQITHLARRAALDMIETSLGPTAGPSRRARRHEFGAKRPTTDLARIAEQFVAFVNKHPGLRIEQINKELGTTTRDLALPVRKLIADGTIKTKGKKRSTVYFAT